MDLQKWVVGFMMFGLFVIAITGFLIGFASDNNSAVNVADDSQITALYSGTANNISATVTSGETSTNSIVNSSVATGSQTTQTGSQFAITPASSIGIAKNILLVGYTKIFGTSSNFGIFVVTLLGILTFISGLMVWKAWIGRQPSD